MSETKRLIVSGHYEFDSVDDLLAEVNKGMAKIEGECYYCGEIHRLCDAFGNRMSWKQCPRMTRPYEEQE